VKTTRNFGTDSYQPADRLVRTYQAKLDVAVIPKPPRVSSATVIPLGKPSNNSTSSKKE
jgi:hypothetical protein